MSETQSPFATGISFLDTLGVFEILLPFILVFTVFYAILERTEVLTKSTSSSKSLNSMVAFVTAFIFVASTRLVAMLSEVLAYIVLLVFLGLSLIIVTGVVFVRPDKTKHFLPEPFDKIFFGIVFVGVCAIFLYAWKLPGNEEPALFYAWRIISMNMSAGGSGAVSALILVVLVIGLVMFISRPEGNDGKTGNGAS